ncbi:MAG: cytochrome c oxidase subunit 2 [Limisphaerales bacterium]|jgi:cytochrome c oxidase subunit 2
MEQQSKWEQFIGWQKDMMSMPALGSRHGGEVDEFIIYIHWLMLILFVIWIGYFIYVLFRFNSRRNPTADPVGLRGHSTTYGEIAVVVVEAVLLLGIAIPMWAKQVAEFPKDSEATVIRVAAEQFSWNSRYTGPNGVFAKQDIRLAKLGNTLGYEANDPDGSPSDDVEPPLKDLHAPLIPLMDASGKPVLHPDGEQAYKPVVIRLTSKDVIHSLKVNTLRICQDAMPGMTIPLHFEPTTTGRYLITCAQLCGSGHSTMNAWFSIDTEADFDAWLVANKRTATTGAGFE